MRGLPINFLMPTQHRSRRKGFLWVSSPAIKAHNISGKLMFKVGEIIRVTKIIDGGEWEGVNESIKGKRVEKKGMFPIAFTELWKPGKGELVVAVTDSTEFDQIEPNEHSPRMVFDEGSVIIIDDSSVIDDNSGMWWEGHHRGQRVMGWFPSYAVRAYTS